MIDVGLFILMVFLGVASFLMGYFIGAVFTMKKEEPPAEKKTFDPCVSLDDIIKREG